MKKVIVNGQPLTKKQFKWLSKKVGKRYVTVKKAKNLLKIASTK